MTVRQEKFLPWDYGPEGVSLLLKARQKVKRMQASLKREIHELDHNENLPELSFLS